MRSPSLLSSEGDRTNSLIFMHLTDNLCHAIALSRKLVLLTGNHRALGKLPGLLIEGWMV
ncbi:hypothetical protein [Nostoc sp.]|uniref:hypothetical protein n=1 Tax=Nostoc sp. TaxID=1180 RepID=UPI002FF6E639